MPSVQQQLSFVLNAPVLFFLTQAAVTIAIWSLIRWLYQWRYDSKTEQLEAMLRLAAEENKIAKERYADAKALIDELGKDKGEVQGAKDTVTQEKLRLAIDSAVKANAAVDETLRRGAALTAGFPIPFHPSTGAGYR
jgi:ABC-type transport system involved in cytochrome c biogenesis permease subunit